MNPQIHRNNPVMPRSMALAFALTLHAFTTTGAAPAEGAQGRPPSIHDRSAYFAGKAAAKHDISKGVLAIEYPLPALSAWQNEYENFLLKHYGVRIHTTGRSCCVTSTADAHTSGYNEVSKSEIKHRFGNDAFEKAEKAATRRNGFFHRLVRRMAGRN